MHACMNEWIQKHSESECLNPNYISFSLKKIVDGQALSQEGKDVLALPRMLILSGTEWGPALTGLAMELPPVLMGVGRGDGWQAWVRPAVFMLITGFSHIYSLKVISYFK